jgi:hypothetical protein
LTNATPSGKKDDRGWRSLLGKAHLRRFRKTDELPPNRSERSFIIDQAAPMLLRRARALDNKNASG